MHSSDKPAALGLGMLFMEILGKKLSKSLETKLYEGNVFIKYTNYSLFGAWDSKTLGS
jgi:hypothetical protein